MPIQDLGRSCGTVRPVVSPLALPAHADRIRYGDRFPILWVPQAPGIVIGSDEGLDRLAQINSEMIEGTVPVTVNHSPEEVVYSKLPQVKRRVLRRLVAPAPQVICIARSEGTQDHNIGLTAQLVVYEDPSGTLSFNKPRGTAMTEHLYDVVAVIRYLPRERHFITEVSRTTKPHPGTHIRSWYRCDDNKVSPIAEPNLEKAFLWTYVRASPQKPGLGDSTALSSSTRNSAENAPQDEGWERQGDTRDGRYSPSAPRDSTPSPHLANAAATSIDIVNGSPGGEGALNKGAESEASKGENRGELPSYARSSSSSSTSNKRATGEPPAKFRKLDCAEPLSVVASRRAPHDSHISRPGISTPPISPPGHSEDVLFYRYNLHADTLDTESQVNLPELAAMPRNSEVKLRSVQKKGLRVLIACAIAATTGLRATPVLRYAQVRSVLASQVRILSLSNFSVGMVRRLFTSSVRTYSWFSILPVATRVGHAMVYP